MGFPKWVYKSGTGKKVEGEKFEAEGALVNSEEEISALGGVWVDSPGAAFVEAKAKPEAKPEVKAGAFELLPDAKAEEKPAKKGK